MDRFNQLRDNLIGLGPRKLSALALIFTLVLAITGLGAYYVSRPDFEVLYSGLDREDVSRIGAVLKSSGVAFDINPEGNAVLVRYGQTAQARMLLAERGLPQSANAGYELFDKVGSLGLTSFMQEVTRVRALEGELARTIQLIRGVKAARVHIVLPDEGSFRRVRQPPSASVVIRTESPDDSKAAQAIRHLVAASIPGMTVDQVTVLNTDGMLLSASDGDATDAAPAKTLTLEKTVSKDIQDNIRRTLTPYLRLANFQVSVRARINTDRKQTNETIFDPESRVERSVRVVKENSTSQNNSTSQAASVERNVPQEKPQAGGEGKQSNDENKKSEELTNFELSTKTVTTVSGGYTLENLSIAVLVNRGSLAGSGKDAPKPEALERQLKEIEQLVASAAGVRKDRGDTVKVSAVDFAINENDLAPVEPAGWSEALTHQLGSVINAGALILVTLLLVFFGLRPASRALLAEAPAPMETALADDVGPPLLGAEPSIELPFAPMEMPQFTGQMDTGLIEDIGGREKFNQQKKLEQLIEADEMQAAAILKQWMYAEGSV
ncbi:MULTISPECIES: flagellar basal-body MS-ring/collar protein FliF [Methylosinus]|uniref:Flagellar M-ring protein n=1 Tax=Methylosinus trichosporium (strain ATCC 35070 / NCIMB 11131 / UNIQEM 75 / OB3b) TaxID=595536 RepID=A0A2D2D3U6_METT3|nr:MULTISPECIES: flagellar basal-body MS-ring/collar protein FliF [Methylosinus]ATQ69672.1 flagellar M-ring protein FliF [Methylosinus trichosporium OB3b]OBS51240.1 flagellar M-ring protein FliF [Methylosinus sp. 3S-1]